MVVWILFWFSLPSGSQIPPPQNPPRLVNDFAGLMSPSQEADLERQLVRYDDSTSTQIVIVTMRDLGGYEISEFSYELGDQWGVGQSGKDNGLVITVSADDRQVFMATGWGTEGYITDVQAKRIIDQYMIPHFKQGDYYTGLQQGTRVIAGLLSGAFEADRLKKDEDFPVGNIIFILLFVAFLVFLFSRGGGGNGGMRRGGGWDGPIIIGSGGFGRGFGGGMGGSIGGGGFGGFGGGGFGGGGAGGSW